MPQAGTSLEKSNALAPQNGFWSGNLGLTLIMVSLIIVIFVVTPLQEAGVRERYVVDVIIFVLMVSGLLSVEKNRTAAVPVLIFLVLDATFIAAGRLHPTPGLHQFGSVLTTITLLLYFRIVILVLFRTGPITWNRVHGGICAYLLLGLAWASAFQVVEQATPGSFHFVTPPADFDQLIAKLTYYSFATITTVGCDVTAVSPIARSLTIAEATTGALFPAILIGALVGLAMQQQSKSN
jgi:hypothetical protein